MQVMTALAAMMAPLKIELRLERQKLAQALYLSGAAGKYARIRVWEVRAEVRAVFAEHGTRGVGKLYRRAVSDAEQLNSIQPDEHHWEGHVGTLNWCLEQVDRAFRPRAKRRRKVAEPTALVDLPMF